MSINPPSSSDYMAMSTLKSNFSQVDKDKNGILSESELNIFNSDPNRQPNEKDGMANILANNKILMFSSIDENNGSIMGLSQADLNVITDKMSNKNEGFGTQSDNLLKQYFPSADKKLLESDIAVSREMYEDAKGTEREDRTVTSESQFVNLGSEKDLTSILRKRDIFDSYDQNKDGSLDESELSNFGSGYMGRETNPEAAAKKGAAMTRLFNNFDALKTISLDKNEANLTLNDLDAIYIAEIGPGQKTFNQLATKISASKLNPDSVNALYQEYFHRPATAADINNWVNSGSNFDAVKRAFAVEAAKPTTIAGVALQDKVAAIYRAYRPQQAPSADEIVGWASQGEAALANLESILKKEGHINTSTLNKDSVNALYQEYFHRPATAGEINNWVNSGSNLNAMESAFAAEAAKPSTIAGVALQDKVTAIYNAYRPQQPPSADEIVGWASQGEAALANLESILKSEGHIKI